MFKTLDELGGCWPTHPQELLLKAAVLHGETAISAWKEWISSVDIERLDWGSYRLIPLLYQNLSELGVDDPIMKRLKGVYRYTWCKNQVLFGAMSRFLPSFSEAGINTMVLKGPALVLLHYGDYGLRPMDDFDILVPTERATDAINLLKEHGFVPVKEKSPETILPKRHSTPFRNSSQLNLDLHWHIFEDTASGADDSDFWDAAVPVTVNGVSSCALNPADQMLHAFVHGIKWNAAPPFRWIADAMTIVKTSGNEIDWGRLVEKARKCRFVLPVRDGLVYLQEEFGANVPKDILQALHSEPVTNKERILYDVQVRPYNKYGRNRMLFIQTQFERYLVVEQSDQQKNKLVRFLNFIKIFWKVDNYWKIPFYAIGKSIRRVFLIGHWYKSHNSAESITIRSDGSK